MDVCMLYVRHGVYNCHANAVAQFARVHKLKQNNIISPLKLSAFFDCEISGYYYQFTDNTPPVYVPGHPNKSQIIAAACYSMCHLPFLYF